MPCWFFRLHFCSERWICCNVSDKNLIKLLLLTSIFSQQSKSHWVESLHLDHQAQLGRATTSSSPGPTGQTFHIFITRPNRAQLLHRHHHARSGGGTCNLQFLNQKLGNVITSANYNAISQITRIAHSSKLVRQKSKMLADTFFQLLTLVYIQ